MYLLVLIVKVTVALCGLIPYPYLMHPSLSSWFNTGALLKIPDKCWFLIRGMGRLPGAKILYHPGRFFSRWRSVSGLPKGEVVH
jgi:hypothetical protein